MGLFNLTMPDDPQEQAMMALYAGLLSGKGNFGSIAGNSVMGAMETLNAAKKRQEEAQARKLQARLQEAQMEKLMAETKYRQGLASKGIDPEDPSDIRSARLFMQMTPEQQLQALQWRRGDNELKEMNGVLNRVSKSGLGGIAPLTTLDNEAGAQAAIAGARQRAQEQAKADYDLVPTFNPQNKRSELKTRSSLLPGDDIFQRIIADAQKSGDKSVNYNIGGQRGTLDVPSAPQTPEEAKRSDVRDADEIKAKTAFKMLDQAEKALPGATGSGVGAVVDKIAGWVGKSPEGSIATADLKPLAGWLSLNTPRFEGPQSDKDRLVYEQMVGQIADDTVPVDRRLKAVKRVREIYETYSNVRSEVRGGATQFNDPDKERRYQEWKARQGK